MKLIKLITFLILILFIAACGTAPTATETNEIPTIVTDKTLVSEGRLEPIHYIELALNASGLVSEVLFVEGQTVTAGDVIARLEASEAQTLESAQAGATQELTRGYQDVRDAQLKLDNFDIPSEYAGMTPSQAVDATLVKLNQARADFEPYRYINHRNLEQTEAEKNGEVITGTAKVYKKRLDDAWARYRKAIQWLELESNLEIAQARLEQAQKDYISLTDPSFSEETAGARAALANAEVRAPFAGVITDLKLKVGEYAALGQPVVTVADISRWVVKTTNLTEIDVVNITEGQDVIVKLDAIPNIELYGNVLSISQNFSQVQGDVVYEVIILLTDLDPNMRWGMTAEVMFKPFE